MFFYFTNMICLLEKSDTIDKQIRVHFEVLRISYVMYFLSEHLIAKSFKAI